jgi:hypothetical protein
MGRRIGTTILEQGRAAGDRRPSWSRKILEAGSGESTLIRQLEALLGSRPTGIKVVTTAKAVAYLVWQSLGVPMRKWTALFSSYFRNARVPIDMMATRE